MTQILAGLVIGVFLGAGAVCLLRAAIGEHW